MLQIGEAEPFICDLLRNIQTHTNDLEPLQVNTFYEAVGLMVSAEPDTQRAAEYLQQLMSIPNMKWQEIMAMARQNTMALREADPAKSLANILATNTSVCTSVRGPFQKQLGLILMMFWRCTRPTASAAALFVQQMVPLLQSAAM